VRQILDQHSYEELRGIVVDILVGREKIENPPEQYLRLVSGVGEVLARRGTASPIMPLTSSSDQIRPHPHDVELVRDVFWDLFRQGFITLGLNANNDEWPWFRLSHNAKNTLDVQSPYRFHDSSSYLKMVRGEVPDVSAESLLYLDEAIAAFYADCLLASCVMLGVAAESEFLRLLGVGSAHPVHGAQFEKAQKERTIRQKIVKFQYGLSSLPKSILDQAGEDLETHLIAIQSILRVARNEAGHPTATRPPSREQVYVYLQLFIPFAGQLRRLRVALTQPG
jgi:hypothetical protein